MATKRKTGALATAAKTVKNAAKTVVRAADEHVVEPVGKALGLTGKKRPARKKTAAPRKATAQRAAKATGTKSHATKRPSKTKGR
jgi:hypothetical protein